MPNKNDLLQHLKNAYFCILSTASAAGKPESAVLAYVVKDDLTLILNTEGNTRKVSHILSNPQVSIIVGSQMNSPSLQIDGTAKILDNQESAAAQDFTISVHPEAKNYLSDTGKFIAITPSWIRWSNFGVDPAEIVEFNDLSKL